MLTFIQTIILGIVEGLSEFLPISSTGHLSLTSHILHIPQSDQLIIFEIAIQLGAILAVVVLYFKKFFNINLIKKLIVAFLPTGIIGITVFKYIKTLLSSEYIIAVSLALGGVLLIWTEKFYRNNRKEKIDEITYKDALILGLAQSIAIIPGVSRSGAVIAAGLLKNIKRSVLVEFTFLLAVPTMTVATFYSLYKNREILTFAYGQTLIIGFVVSFLVALIVIKYFLNYIKRYDFIPFGIYRILVGIIVLIVLI